MHAKRKKKSWEEDERILHADLLPPWERRKVNAISRRDVSDPLDGIVDRGAPIMANRTRALISKILKFGMSHMTSMGISRLVVSKILNHAESGITAVYDRHSYDPEKRDALDRWGAQLGTILNGKTHPPPMSPTHEHHSTSLVN